VVKYEVEKVGIITISRETESLGDEIATQLSKQLNYECIDRERLAVLLHEAHQEDLDENIDRQKFLIWAKNVKEVLLKQAKRGPIIFLGRGGQTIFQNDSRAFHLLIVSSPELRLQRIMEKYRQDEVTASHILAELDRKREKFLLEALGADWKNPLIYHLVLNTAYYTVNQSCQIIQEAIKNLGVHRTPKEQQLLFPSLDFGGNRVEFVHPSEEEFARILDFYRIKWLYEPRTFPLEWDSEGNVVEAFSPDFYLPDFDLFIELTTQKQKLVRKKNRKVKRLKDLYPKVKIKVIYSRDYTHLLRKFGVEEDI